MRRNNGERTEDQQRQQQSGSDYEYNKFGKIIMAGGVNIQYSKVGGVAIEFGTLSTDKGWNQDYMTIYPLTYGFPSVSSSVAFIFSKKATFSNWRGSYTGGAFGWGMGTILAGGSTGYSVLGLGFSYGWGAPKRFGNLSGSFQMGKTTLLRNPYFKPYPHGTSPFSNIFYGELYGL